MAYRLRPFRLGKQCIALSERPEARMASALDRRVDGIASSCGSEGGRILNPAVSRPRAQRGWRFLRCQARRYRPARATPFARRIHRKSPARGRIEPMARVAGGRARERFFPHVVVPCLARGRACRRFVQLGVGGLTGSFGSHGTLDIAPGEFRCPGLAPAGYPAGRVGSRRWLYRSDNPQSRMATPRSHAGCHRFGCRIRCTPQAG